MKLKLTEFPREKTCTEMPSKWTKPRTEGIRSEAVMSNRVVKPKFGISSSGIKPSLYEARANDAKKAVSTEEANEVLKRINPLFGFCLTTGGTAGPTHTKMGFIVPMGSPLSYQLAVSEGDFSVTENLPSVDVKIGQGLGSPPDFPWNDRLLEEDNPDGIQDIGLVLTHAEACDLFTSTKDQAGCDLWFEVRKKRLTASKFGAVMKRKKIRKILLKTTCVTQWTFPMCRLWCTERKTKMWQ
ncbi:hypothetical protein DPMN_010709 [Dreissena polymorpha]|uniref:Uncharacterized protein n=1 Tax=Dreissena polymorpha TaxID=45954 RepID=A0A9D4RZI3_DREPO|nr:hypothetical protein DPMN_010709 [Dreissena polymorpha]